VSSIATAEAPDTYEPRWFDLIEPCEYPWRDWFSMLQFPGHSGTDSWIEGLSSRIFAGLPTDGALPWCRRHRALPPRGRRSGIATSNLTTVTSTAASVG